MFPRSINSSVSAAEEALISETDVDAVMAQSDALVAIDDVQKSLNRSRASVYRYTNTDPRNLNPPFNPKKLNQIKSYFTNNFKPYVIGKITKNFKEKVKLNGSVNWI